MAVALQSVTGSPQNSATLRPPLLKSKRKMPAAVKPAAANGKDAGGRRVIFGIEVESEIAYKGWKIGRAYTKKVTLKNVTFQSQKLQFQAPSSEIFTTLYPKLITLSPGTSFVIPVTFKPVILQKHEDALAFMTADGCSFEVPLRGQLPEYQLAAPECLNFGVCAAHDQLSLRFALVNESSLATQFIWQSVPPFEFLPQKGDLAAYDSVEIVVNFVPDDAKRFILDSLLLYGDKLQRSLKLRLEGIAKYPQVMFSIDGYSLDEVTTVDGQLIVEFGNVSFGDSSDRLIQLRNPSTVGASVEVTRLDNIHPIDRVFDCPVERHKIAAGEILNVALRYSPKLPWTTSVEYFLAKVSNKCGNLVIKCVGSSLGPQLKVSANLVNFSQLMAGQTATHPIHLLNNGDTDVVYEFDIDTDTSVFLIDKPNGIVEARASKQLVVTFRPTLPIQFYRRVTLLAPDQEPIFIDLLGTCHDIYLRPVVLQPLHLKLFHQRNQRGIGYYPPEQLESWLQSGQLQISPEDDSLLLPEAEKWEGECEPIESLPPWKEFFFGDGHGDVVYSAPHVALESTHLDFGRTDAAAAAAAGGVSRSICLKNSTKGTMIFSWTPPPNPELRRFFFAEPKTVELPANSSATISISFRPDEVDKIFATELEGFAYFKSQRDFQIVNEKTLAPPFCLTLKCIGHTFKQKSEPFMPRFQLDREQLVFPSINVDDMFFRSVSLINVGDSPIYFRATDLNAPFAIKPACGVVPPSQCRIFSVKCVPHLMQKFVSRLNVELNERKDPLDECLMKIPLLGSADKATVFLENRGELYFPPTNIGNSLSRNYPVKNTSRVPLLFKWKIHYTQSGLVSVYPESGRLEPNESLAQTWTISPQDEGRILLKPTLIVQGISQTGSLMEQATFPLRIIGQGSHGCISSVEPYVDYGTMVIGSSAVRPITLLNQSDCAVYYRLVVGSVIDGPYDQKDLAEDPSSFELSHLEGWIQARCKQQIRATVRPMRRVFYQYNLAYFLMSNPDESGNCTPLSEEPQHLCHLLSTGVYPTISITDIQGWLSARRLKKKLLWEYFSIDSLNDCLHADPTASELIYTVATRQSFCRTPKVMTRAVLDFNFGAAPLGFDDSCVQLLFENKGHVTTEFQFLMPEELQMELEYWAETGEYTEDELHQLKVQSKRLFKISPSKGELQPGSAVVVQFAYSHEFASTDRLPVLLKVNKGREILLNFTGVTTEPGRSYLHFHSSKHSFNPVPIGEPNPAVQVCDLYNGGDQSLRFRVDCQNLTESRLQNFNCQVLDCLTKTGEIAAGRSFELQFKFCPIEARTYSFELPIEIENGETAVITFSGVGFDKRALGSNAPPAGAQEDLKVASRQAIPLQDQLAILSEERLTFANIPVLSRNRRIVFLNNMSLDRPVQFRWHVTHRAHSQIVTVSPPSGTLDPGESALCHLTLLPDASPRFYDLDLICELHDIVRLEQWSDDLRDWQEQLRKRQEEFTITEQDLQVEKLRKAAKQQQQREAAAAANSKSNRNNNSSNSNSSKYRKDLTEDDFIRKPMKPEPFLLHLGVTAQSHNIHDFQTQFPDLLNQVCMDRTLVQTQNKRGGSEANDAASSSEPKSAEDFEGEIVEMAVTNVLHSLLGDADLISAIQKVHQEPVPYFRQLPKALVGCASATQSATHSDGEEASIKFPSDSAAATDDAEEAAAAGAAPTDQQQQVIANESRTTFSMPGSEPLSSRSTSRSIKASTGTNGFGREADELEKEATLKSSHYNTLCEAVLENILVNIMSEVNQREFDVTARPRLIALPPRRKSRTPQSSHR